MAGKGDNPLPGSEDDGDGLDRALNRVGDLFNKVTQIDFTRKPTETDRFFRLVKNGRIDEVREMLDAGFDPNAYNKSGDTPLHVAARANLTAMAQLLADRGADPRKGRQDDPGHLPLDDAVNFGKAEMTEFFARHGGYLPGNTVDGWSLLHRACEKGKTRIVKALLDAGADGNEPTKNGATPLLIAVMRSQAEVAEVLLEYPAVVNGLNSIHVRTDSLQRNAFQLAVERGMSALVARMIGKGVMPNVQDLDGMTPLRQAILREDPALVRVLVRAGADLNQSLPQAGTPLLFACETAEIQDDEKRAEIVDILLRHGADPDLPKPVSGRTPLMSLAAADGRGKTLECLLAYLVRRDICDRDGMSAVFHALGNPQALRLLLDAGAGADARHMKDAATPLIAAAKAGNAAAVHMLLAAGANPKFYDAAGRSALSYARARQDDAGAEIARAIETKLQDDLLPGGPKAAKGQAWDL